MSRFPKVNHRKYKKEDEVIITKRDWVDSHFKYTPRYQILQNPSSDPAQPSVHILPDDCIDLIFSYLSFEELVKVCGVCKRWYNGCLFAFSRRGDKLFMFMFMKYMNTKYFAGSGRSRAVAVR